MVIFREKRSEMIIIINPRYEAWALAWTMDKCYMLLVPVHVHAAFLCPYCIFMSTLHVTVHAACPCPCCMPVFVLHVPAAWT
jgi:hypothetical protein